MVFERPSPRLWVARQSVLAAVLVLLLALTSVLALIRGSVLGEALGLLVLLTLAATAWTLMRGRYRSWGYCERHEDLLVRRGLLFRQLSVVPYGRMQFVDVRAGPVDRLFGLATVQLHTAAAASDARIPGLLQADADRLRDRLATVGEARATGL